MLVCSSLENERYGGEVEVGYSQVEDLRQSSEYLLYMEESVYII